MVKKPTVDEAQVDDHIKTEVLHDYGRLNQEVDALSMQVHNLCVEARQALSLANNNPERFAVHYNNATLERLQKARQAVSTLLNQVCADARTLTQEFKSFNLVPIQANPKVEQ